MTDNQTTTTKLQFKTDNELWKKVQRYKIERGLDNNNIAVEELINLGLFPRNKNIISLLEGDTPLDTIETINIFRENIPISEKKEGAPLLILKDKKSGAYYCECHIQAKDFVKLSDPDAVIDKEFQEEFKANRELEPDNQYFLQMVEDAIQGRQFCDIVIEYCTSYREEKPLKILGGQHRNEAIKKALKQNVNEIHGLRVYFDLDKNQLAEIMRVSNTNINVSPDLRDRIEEHRLTPGGMLRQFCYKANILNEGDDFGDKRRYEKDFNPTVRMIRTFIVNFFKGKEYEGTIDNDAYVPYFCISGREIDPEYFKYFNQFKQKTKFDDKGLIEAAKMFAKLHDIQYKNAEKIQSSAKKEYKIKAFSYAVISSWAFAVGVLQNDKHRLKKLYSLPDFGGENDPLNASAMSKAKHKTDSDTYRGLGTRTDAKERGRLLQLFLNYSKSDKPKITEQMCVAAIDIYHANKARIEAEEQRRKAF